MSHNVRWRAKQDQSEYQKSQCWDLIISVPPLHSKTKPKKPVGRSGGRATSPAKAAAVLANGKLVGRPKKVRVADVA